ncbi:MAG: hypothetical protein ACFFBI_12130 [Promethearchaeota archaeon]
MFSTNITNANIQRIDDFSKTNLRISLSKFKNLQEYDNLLIIQTAIEDSIKLSIYPIHKERIIKVTLCGLKLTKKILKEISKILHKFQVIHTSGFIKIKKQLFYECYLNLSLSDNKSVDLQTSLEKIKKIFKQIKIEEISLNNNRDS